MQTPDPLSTLSTQQHAWVVRACAMAVDGGHARRRPGPCRGTRPQVARHRGADDVLVPALSPRQPTATVAHLCDPADACRGLRRSHIAAPSLSRGHMPGLVVDMCDFVFTNADNIVCTESVQCVYITCLCLTRLSLVKQDLVLLSVAGNS